MNSCGIWVNLCHVLRIIPHCNLKPGTDVLKICLSRCICHGAVSHSEDSRAREQGKMTPVSAGALKTWIPELSYMHAILSPSLFFLLVPPLLCPLTFLVTPHMTTHARRYNKCTCGREKASRGCMCSYVTDLPVEDQRPEDEQKESPGEPSFIAFLFL